MVVSKSRGGGFSHVKIYRFTLSVVIPVLTQEYQPILRSKGNKMKRTINVVITIIMIVTTLLSNAVTVVPSFASTRADEITPMAQVSDGTTPPDAGIPTEAPSDVPTEAVTDTPTEEVATGEQDSTSTPTMAPPSEEATAKTPSEEINTPTGAPTTGETPLPIETETKKIKITPVVGLPVGKSIIGKDTGKPTETKTPPDVTIMRVIDPVEVTNTYKFYVNNVLAETQIIRDGGKLTEPASPEPGANQKFAGWWTVVDNVEVEVDFDTPIAVGAANQEIRVDAKFISIVYVYFISEGSVVTTKELTPGGTTDASGIALNITTPGKAFSHWSDSTSGGPFDFSTPITQNTNLYAVLIDQWKVTFNTKGGTPVLPVYVNNGQNLTGVTTPTKAGYTFKHWSLTDGGSAYALGTAVTSALTLFAVWEPRTDTPYTVVYWKENPNDAGYSYVEQNSRTGTTGLVASYATKTYTGFALNSAKTDAAPQITIAGDGTTVKHVYYDRVRYTLVFRKDSDNTVLKSYPGIKYQQDTSYWWNEAVALYPNYIWAVDRGGSVYYSFPPDMPNSNLTIYGQTTGSYTYTIHYVEKDTSPTVFIKADFVFKGPRSLSLTSEDFIAIPGFTVRPITSGDYNDFGTDREATIRYTRNSYIITFHKNDGSGSVSTSPILYQADISGQALSGYIEGVTIRGDGYRFDGWYTTSTLADGTKFSFAGQKMPFNNLILYAKWLPPTHNVTSFAMTDGSGGSSVQIVPHGQKASEGSTIVPTVPAGMTATDFMGWYWFVNNVFVPFDFDMSITQDINLYPVWPNTGFHVTYDVNGGPGTAPEDASVYLSGSAATLKAGVTAPAGKVFLGWNTAADGTGTMYQPGSKVSINGNVTLFAIYGPANGPTKITYNANGGVGADIVVSLLNNATHVVQANTFTRAGYYFTGWNTKADGSGTGYVPNDQVMVDRIDETNNVLYAMWSAITYADVIATKEWKGGKTSDYSAVALTLYRKSATVAPEVVTTPAYTVNPTANGNSLYTYTWAQLPQQDSLGNPFTYYVTEPTVPNKYVSAVNGLTVTNTYNTPQGNITAIKSWDGGQKIPLCLTLVRVTSDGGRTPLPPVILDGSKDSCSLGNDGCEVDSWVAKWTGLPSMDGQHYPITYDLVETGVNADGSCGASLPLNYTPTITQEVVNNGTVYTITNKYTSPKPDITAYKKWVGGPVADHAAVTLKVYQNGIEVPTSAYTISVSPINGSSDTFTYTIKGLPKYKSDGITEYIYTVDETAVPTNYEKSLNALTVTNTYKSPLRDVTANKVWKPDLLNPLLKETVAFNLYRYTSINTTPELVYAAQTISGPSWSRTWTNLPATDGAGNTYTYYVTEPTVPTNFTADDVNDLTVTNTYASKTSPVTVTKIWEPANLIASLKTPVTVTLTGTTSQGVTEFGSIQLDGTPDTVCTAALCVYESAAWVATWVGIPDTDANGYTYTFSTTETTTLPNFKLPVYGGEGRALTVTNEYQTPNNTVTATKKWMPAELNPELKVSVVFNLYRYTTANPTPELVEAGVTISGPSWNHTWSDQPVTDGNGNVYTYFVTEPEVPTNFTADKVNDLEVTNTYHAPTAGVPVAKEWAPGGLLDDLKKPVVISLNRYTSVAPTPVSVATTELNSGNNWAFTFPNMPKTDDNGYTYTYTITETTNLGANYLAPTYKFVNGVLIVVNEYKSPVTTITIAKSWVPSTLIESLKVDVTLELHRYSVAEADSVVKTATLTGDEATPWKLSYELPVNDPKGNPYTYYVKETPELSAPYATTYSADGLTAINTYASPTQDIPIAKVWDPADYIGKVPVTIELRRVTTPVTTTQVAGTVVLDASKNWKYTFEDMPLTDGDGRPYTYSIVETTPMGANITVSYRTTGGVLEVVNKYASPKADVTGTKVWKPDGLIESLKTPVEFKLYRYTTDVTKAAQVGDPITISASPWTATWPKLDTHDLNGNLYTYYVVETTVPTNFTADPVKDLIVTNTYNVPEIDVLVEKQWVPEDYIGKQAVEVQLYRQAAGTNVLELVPGKTLTLDEAGSWKGTFTDLPATDSIGRVYTYSIVETTDLGVEITKSYLTAADGTLIVKNTFNSGKIEKTVEKIWAPAGLIDSLRPDVTLELRRSSATVTNALAGTVTLTGGETPTPWQHTFTNLDAKDTNGNVYTYWVVETTVLDSRYTKVEDGLAVTNTYTSPASNVTGTKIWLPTDLNPDLKIPVEIELIGTTAINNVAVETSFGAITLNGEADTACDTAGCVYESAAWVATWVNIPDTDINGNIYTFSIKENTPLTDFLDPVYGGSGRALTVTNTFQSAKANVDATKVWAASEGSTDGVGPMPDVWFQLYRNIAGEAPYIVPDQPIVQLVSPNVTATWQNLDVKDSNGFVYTYSVKEVDALGNDYTPPNYVKIQTGDLEITNIYTPAKLTLVKNLVNAYNGPAEATDWTLTALADVQKVEGVTLSADVTGVIVLPGTYALSEAPAIAGYVASDWTCTGGTQTGASVVIATGDQVTCSITNSDLPASLTLEKIVINAFNGKGQPSDWTLTADGPIDLVGAGYATSDEMHAGTYTLTEASTLTGYEASAWTCEGGVLDGNELTLVNGESAACEITNSDLPVSLTLEKIVVNDNGGTALPSNWILSATNQTIGRTTTITRNGNQSSSTNLDVISISGPGGATGNDLTAGVYELVEASTITGYTASAWSCEGGILNGNLLTLAVGETASCTITNDDQPAYLTLVNVVVNGPAADTDWTMSATGGTTISGLTGTPAVTEVEVLAGTYDLLQQPVDLVNPPLNYTTGDWSCVVGDPVTPPAPAAPALAAVAGSVVVPNGQHIVCTIVNTYKIPVAPVEATKEWVNGPAVKPDIWFKLYRQIAGGPVVEVPGAAILLLSNGTTKVTWNDVEQTDITGKPYIFSVKEVDAAGNDYAPASYTKFENGLNVRNEYTVLSVLSIGANKIWSGGPAEHPTIQFQLYQNGVAFQAPKNLPNGITNVVWNNLPDRDLQGNLYTYTVDEVSVPAGYQKSVNGNDITNTYIVTPPPPTPTTVVPQPTATPIPVVKTPITHPVLIPVTGDTSSFLLYGFIFLLALILLAALIIKGKLFSKGEKKS